MWRTNTVPRALRGFVAAIALLLDLSVPGRSSAQVGNQHAAAQALADASGVRSLIKAGQYAEAELLALTLVAEAESAHGKDSLETARTIDALVGALFANRKTRAPETRTLAERTVAIKEQRLGPDDIDLAISLQNLSWVLEVTQNFPDATKYCERALAIREKSLGPEHLDVADSLHALARLRHYGGDAAASAVLFERTLAIREKNLGPEDILVARTLHDSAELCRDRGDYAKARLLHERGLAIVEHIYGPDSVKLITYLTDLASVLQEMGDYAEARALRERVVPLATAYGEDALSSALTNLGTVLAMTGDYAEAKPLFERTLAIDEKLFGPDDPSVAVDLGNLGALLSDSGDGAAAIPLIERAINITEASMGDDSPALMQFLPLLGSLRTDQGEYTAAKALFERALPMAEANFGPDHPWVGDILLSMAQSRAEAGAYEEAQLLFERQIANHKKSRGSDHPFVADGLVGLAAVQLRLGNNAQAIEASLSAETIGRETLRLTSRTLSEREALRYASIRPSGIDIAISASASSLLGATVSASVYDAVIRSRALVLDEMVSRRRLLDAGADPEVTDLRESLMAASRRLGFLLVQGASQEDPDSYLETLDQARRDKDQAEKALAQKSLVFRQKRDIDRVGLTEVSQHLAPDSALVSYALYNRSVGTGSLEKRTVPAIPPIPSYAAFVLRGGGTPRLIPLGTAEEINGLVARWQQEVAQGRSGSGRSSAEAEAAYRRAGEALRRKAWDPLAASLGKAQRVFVVPDGAMNLVSLASLPRGASDYLVEAAVVLHELSVERDLVSREAEGRGGTGLFALGGPDFDATKLFAALTTAVPEGIALVAPDASRKTFRGERSACADFQAIRFQPLPGTAREVEEVVDLWSTSGFAVPALLDAVTPVEGKTGAAASETAFKRDAQGHRILHLATHGFFLDGHCASVLDFSRGVAGLATAEHAKAPGVSGESPLLLSGLALAGANHRSEAGATEDDGILTAEEIAALDLSGVEWAVLSACDTGVGEIKAGEGVFGLRRAFQVAGARTLIMSLWSVEDESARAWMKALYTARLKEHLDTASSVQAASLVVLKERRAKKQSTHPFYWAGFVAAGDWR